MQLHASRFDRDLSLVDLGTVDLAGAVRLLDEAIGDAARDHRYAEDALADTAFTLTRPTGATLDVSVLTADRIQIRFEGSELIEPKLFGFLRTPFTYETLLPSRAGVVALIEAFAPTTIRNSRPISRASGARSVSGRSFAAASKMPNGVGGPMKTFQPRVIVLTLLVLTLVVASSSAAGEPARAGKHVNIVSERCPVLDCFFTTWTAIDPTKLHATPDQASAIVAELAKGASVDGIAARTITTYLPLCTFVEATEGHRAGCAESDCESVKFRAGEKFFLRDSPLGRQRTLIEYHDSEFEIVDRLALVRNAAGKPEFVRGYRCDGELAAEVWVQVRLANGTTGWAFRESFDGTINYSGGGVVGEPDTSPH